MNHSKRIAYALGTALLTLIVGMVLAPNSFAAMMNDKHGSSGSSMTSERQVDLEFMQAAANGSLSKVKTLLDKGANIEAANDKGATALMWAVMKDQTNVVKFLVDEGANVNAETSTGMTALKVAAAEGRLDTVKFLLNHGADVNASRKGKSAIKLAKESNHRDIVQFLESYDNRSEKKVSENVRHENRMERASDHERTSRHGRVTEAVVTGVDRPDNCLKIRSGAGKEFEQVGCAKMGADLRVTGNVQNGWAEITAPTRGWVFGSQIKAEGLFPAGSSSSARVKAHRSDSDRNVEYTQPEAEYGYVSPDRSNVEVQPRPVRPHAPGVAVELGLPPVSVQGGLPVPPAPPAPALPPAPPAPAPLPGPPALR